MKKICLILLMFLVVMIPRTVKAAHIIDIIYTGPKTVYSGDEITITLKAIPGGFKDKEGIWLAASEFLYDKKILTLTDVSASNFNTAGSFTDNGVILLSEFIENNNIPGICVDGLLYCNTYTLTLKFFVHNVRENTNTIVKLNEFAFGTLIINEIRDYTEEDIIETEYGYKKDLTISVWPSENEVKEVPKVNIPQQNNNTSTKKSTTNGTTKSNNSNLKSLVIENYELEFDKDKIDYDLSVNEDINALKITATPENGKAKVEIIGQDDIKKNNNIIKIIVTAEDKSTKTYTIKINNDAKENLIDSEEETILEKFNFKNLNQQVFIIGGLVLGFIFLIFLVFFIIKKKNDHELNKLLKKM